MSIKLYLPERLSRLVKDKFLFELNGETLGECLKQLISFAPPLKRSLFHESGKELDDQISVFVNKEDAGSQGMGKKVKDGDVIHIVMMSQH